MMSSTTKNGVKITERGRENGTEASLSVDAVKLLKTQDAGYLQTILQQTKREREKVQKDLILAGTGVDNSKTSKKTTFDENGMQVEEEAEDMAMDDFDFSDEEAESSEDDAAAEVGLTKEQIKLRRQKKHARQVLQGRFEAVKEREKTLTTALNHLDKQRAKMNNTVGGVNKSGVKFKLRERKR